MKKTLFLTLNRKWFDMILKGEKLEEYREIKPYWERRFAETYEYASSNPRSLIWREMSILSFKEFDEIQFKNGYSKNAPTMMVECRGIEIGISKPEWCDDGKKKVFVIKLGNLLSHKNCK